MCFERKPVGEITRRLTVYIPVSLEKFLKELADQNESSKNAEAVKILSEAKNKFPSGVPDGTQPG